MIDAIKIVRLERGVGLKDATDTVDANVRTPGLAAEAGVCASPCEGRPVALADRGGLMLAAGPFFYSSGR